MARTTRISSSDCDPVTYQMVKVGHVWGGSREEPGWVGVALSRLESMKRGEKRKKGEASLPKASKTHWSAASDNQRKAQKKEVENERGTQASFLEGGEGRRKREAVAKQSRENE